MEKSLRDLIHVSKEVGGDRQLVQGGGGNTSVKTGDGRMYVKASGTALRDMREGAGYRLIDLQRCLEILEDAELADLPVLEREKELGRRLGESCLDDLKGRPSVESGLHAQFGSVVVHTHPSLVNGVLCAREGPGAIEELFGHMDPPPLCIEYVDFGYALAARVQEAIGEYQQQHGRMPRVVFLENHGMLVSTEEPAEAIELSPQICERVRQTRDECVSGMRERRPARFPRQQEMEIVAEVCAALRREYARISGVPVLVRFSLSGPVQSFFAHPDAEELAGQGPLVPDEVVYCQGPPMWMEVPESQERLRQEVRRVVSEHEAGPASPACLLVDGIGLFAVAPSPKLLESALVTMEAVLEMLVVASCFGGVRPLSEQALEFITQSEVVAYRHRLMAGEGQGEPLQGQVAIVTGAASGLGRGISLGLAGKGMHVVLADLDEEGARETRQRIVDQELPGSAWPVKVDVTDQQSVAALFEYVTTELGGADVLVNAAGVAPPHALVDFPVEQWRKALEVNLTGYFLAARDAARLMIRQGTEGNIINLSSKSGLAASKNNSAYNATKAGEIHLARGWALELAEHGIRVNSVCPGNVFRESKIWNEDYTKAVAEKYGIKPDEVIPYYVNLTALKKQIEWDDIADAIAFLISPSASKITGQTLVVDAGQVFVR